MWYVIYDENRKIVGDGSLNDADDFHLQQALFPNITAVPERVVFAENWVPDVNGAPTVQPRPVLPAALSQTTIAADGADECVISGLPTPCEVVIDDEVYTLVSGPLTFTSETPGVYRVQVSSWPHLDWSADITVEAA